MWKKVLGWALFWGGVFCAINTFSRLFYVFERPHVVEFSIWLTLAAALIWGGWKLGHWKGANK